MREQSVKRRTEGLKLKVKELRVVTGKHVKLGVFDEHDSHKSIISSRQVYATSRDIIKESVSDAPSASGSSKLTHSSPNISAKLLALSPYPVKKNPKPKSRAMDRNKCSTCGVLFNSKTDKEMGSPWLGCDAKGCQFWIHSSCYGFPNADDDTFRNTEFYCKNNIQSKIK